MAAIINNPKPIKSFNTLSDAIIMSQIKKTTNKSRVSLMSEFLFLGEIFFFIGFPSKKKTVRLISRLNDTTYYRLKNLPKVSAGVD